MAPSTGSLAHWLTDHLLWTLYICQCLLCSPRKRSTTVMSGCRSRQECVRRCMWTTAWKDRGKKVYVVKYCNSAACCPSPAARCTLHAARCCTDTKAAALPACLIWHAAWSRFSPRGRARAHRQSRCHDGVGQYDCRPWPPSVQALRAGDPRCSGMSGSWG